MVNGISHLTFIVQDIERATLFFEKIFSAEIVYDSGDQTFSLSRERFFLIGNLWIVVMQGEPLSENTYNHIAFQINECDYDENLGVKMREPRSRIEGEGRSLYFYDFDNHLFELHTGTLAERLKSYNSIKDKVSLF